MSDTVSSLPTEIFVWEQYKYGSIENIKLNKSFKTPILIKDDQILVKVSSASINSLDVVMAGGFGKALFNKLRYYLGGGAAEFPLTLGRDFSGVVVKVGKAVQSVTVGQEVFGIKEPYARGCFAEYIVCSPNDYSLKPSNLSHNEAASLPYAALTAYSVLFDQGNLKMEENNDENKTKNVLILGASGGVGIVAIQLCKYIGVSSIIATCRQQSKELLMSIGCQQALSNEELLTGTPKYYFDLIIDALPGDHFHQFRDLTTAGGRYVSLNPPLLPLMDDYTVFGGALIAVVRLLWRSKWWPPALPYRWGIFSPGADRLRTMGSLVERGLLRPVVQRTFEFSELPNALQEFSQGGIRGKFVVQVASE